MIQTKEYALNKGDYLKVLLLLRLRRSWILLLWFTIFTYYSIHDLDYSTIAISTAAYVIAYFFIILLSLLYWVNAKGNRNIFRNKQLIFTTDKIRALCDQDTIFETPTVNEYAISQIIRKRQMGNFYLLYVAKGQFIVIPKNVFKSNEDQEAFKKLFQFS